MTQEPAERPANELSHTAGPDPVREAPPGPPPPPPNSLKTMRRHGIELLVVFVGVYAAFLLNRFDTDRRDARRREQILDALVGEVESTTNEIRNDIAQAGEFFADFDRRLAAGEMPPVAISFTNTGYSDTDDATLLQSGGL